MDVLGTWVSATRPAQAVDEIGRWIETPGLRSYVCVTGVHGVMESVRDPWLRGVHNRSGLTVPDGMPMVWAGRRAGAHGMSRVCGPDLFLSVLQRAAERGWSSYFYGGAEGVPELLGERMAGRYPGLKVAGAYSPPYRPLTAAEDADVVRRINDSGADLVWVGLSTPKQERWMAEHRDRLEASVLLGVGAAFDFHTGRVPQAPLWMQERGLGWAYRLAKEPRRLWRRYLRNNPEYLARIALRPPRLVTGEPVAAGGCCGGGRSAGAPTVMSGEVR
ncbi:UDP-N-acetyl-D-mannosaminuronic acid transferase [Streptomyces spiroverticillatus]|uniref:UDP-N-acetyl-D-mannosaminuronic acid transferase n=1 Tax=Streptomyces finlayi TaxID=67296 RepID=A0A918WU36_9ACTN|nr:UDP-N-acetyl-D-mannosaminuronic acid transferase [Streptomyces spiroverticillatus]GHC82831.1 UDP-N-acetyl-D-mannosaminuronic acid transferase [Streptomyces finlayi]